jgi:hypothetical protein
VVEHPPHHPEVKSLSSGTTPGTGMEFMAKCKRSGYLLLANIHLQGLYYVTLQIFIAQKMDRLLGKLVFFLSSITFTGLDQHTSLLPHKYDDNP